MCTISEYKNQGAALLRRLATLAVAMSSLWLTPAAVAQDPDHVLPQCEALQVPVSLPQVAPCHAVR